MSTLADIQLDQLALYSANAFAKRLQHVWIYYEMSRLVFVASLETVLAFPRSFQPKTRMFFFARNLPFLYHALTVFWSHHNRFENRKCKDNCSHIMLIDVHQQSRRIVCSFENVTSTSHPEMGPILQGCPPYPPKRTIKPKEQKGEKLTVEFISKEK